MKSLSEYQLERESFEKLKYLLEPNVTGSDLYEHFLNLKIFLIPEISSFLRDFNLRSLEHVISKNPNIASINDLLYFGVHTGGYQDAISIDESQKLNHISIKYNLNEHELLELKNALGIVFIFDDLLKFSNSSTLKKIKNLISIMKFIISTSNKISRKIDYDLSSDLFSSDYNIILKYKTLITLSSDFLKRPVGKSSNVSLNYFVFILNQIAKNKSISKNLEDFTVPILKEIKILYADRFNEINSFDKSYLLKRINEGKKLKEKDELEKF